MNKITMLSKLKIDEELLEKLFDLQEKGIDINFLIREMLEKREAGIAAAKNVVGEQEIKKAEEQAADCGVQVVVGDSCGVRKSSRYISVKVRKILKEEYGDKCSMRGCRRAARQIHHTQRFALAGVHDPRFMAPLCEEHHKIAHAIDMKTREKWRSG